ncbi:MAG: hypothetical protein AAFW89_14130, partial [Bacteroidota bacterium]
MERFNEWLFPTLGNWWLSLLLVLPIWIVTEQFWVALTFNIMAAVNYPYPFFVSPLFFVVDYVTLIIHEAGHTLFGLFGNRLLTILGGSILEILLPFLIFLSGWMRKQRSVAQFSLFWLGFCWYDTAAYCVDAPFRLLPLIGDLPKSAHDFYNILTELNLMSESRTIAMIMFSIGFIAMIASLLYP